MSAVGTSTGTAGGSPDTGRAPPPPTSRRSWGSGAVAVEVRRGGAGHLALALVLLVAALLMFSGPPLQESSIWSSTWAEAAGWMNTASVVAGPLVGAVGAWIGGRERRHRLEELLTTTARPPARRLLLTWWVLALGVVVGCTGGAALVAAAVAPAVSYGGGRWPGAWLLVGLGLLACSAIGWAAGRLVAGRAVAPLVALVLLAAVAVLTIAGEQAGQLAPFAAMPVRGGQELVAWVVPAAAAWYLALATAAVVATLPARRWVAAVPVAVAVALAVPLTHVGTPEFPSESWITPDPASQELVCTDDAPTVCLTTEHASLLPDVVPLARETMADLAPLVDLDRAVEDPGDEGSWPAGVLPVASLDGWYRPFRPGLADPGGVRESTLSSLVGLRCLDDPAAYAEFRTSEPARTAATEAFSLVDAATSSAALPEDLAARWSGDPAAARAWTSAYLEAARTCDVGAMARLGQR